MNQSIRLPAFLLCFVLLLPLLLGLTSCASDPPTENRVTSVTVKGDNVRVEAELTKGFLDSYDQKKIYLFELPSVYSGGTDLSELDPVAEAKPRDAVTFTLPLYDGVRSRLHSSYLVASFDRNANAYVPLTPAAALSDPETLANAQPDEFDRDVSIKGLVSSSPADAIRLGAAHTVVDVHMETLILSGWREGAVSYVYNGVTRYLDAAALDELDETVGVYTGAGVEVYLRFLLGDPTGHDVPAGLYLTGAAAAKAEDYAVNMTASFSAIIMEGFFDFMASRYATPEAGGGKVVNSFIIGRRVNDSVTSNHAVGMELSAYVTNYEKLTRVAYTALASHNASGRVYISLDGRRTVTNGQGWDTAAFLAAFAEEVALRGDYGWHVACELRAETPAVWVDDPAADTARFTIRNLNVLTGLLDSTAYRHKGESRRLLISGFSVPAVPPGGTSNAEQDAKQAASYAYAYLSCVQNGRVEALIYDVHTDPAQTAETQSLCGLWTVAHDTTLTDTGLDLTLRPLATRPIYDVFARIDTTRASDLSAPLTEIMGASYTKLESALAGKASAVTFVSGSGTLLAYTAEHKKASPLYLFNSGSLNGFADGGSLTNLELSAAETLGINTLHARFDREDVTHPMGLTVTLPATRLIGGKELLLDLYGGPLGNASSGEKPTVTLRLTRSSKGSVADGDGEIRYEASVQDVKAGSWQTASFDISGFTTLLDASDEVTLTLVMDYPASTAPKGPSAHHMGLAGVYVTGAAAVSGTSTGVVIAVVAGLILLVGGVTAILFIRHRKKK